MGRVSYSLKLRIFFFDRVKDTLEFRISVWYQVYQLIPSVVFPVFFLSPICFFARVKGTLGFRISYWDPGISIYTLHSISSVLPFPYLCLLPGKGYPWVPDIWLVTGYLNQCPP